MNAIESSMFTGYLYDDSSWILSLQFKSNGSRIHYTNVPPEVADEFESAESKGKFYSANIKGKYETVPDSVMQGPPLEAAVATAPRAIATETADFSAEMDRDIASLEADWAAKGVVAETQTTPQSEPGFFAQQLAAQKTADGAWSAFDRKSEVARPPLPGETSKWGNMAVIPTGYRGADQPNSVTGEMPETVQVGSREAVTLKGIERVATLATAPPSPEPEILSPEQAVAVLAPKNAKVDALTAELNRLATLPIKVVDAASQARAEEHIVKMSQARKILHEIQDPYRAIAYATYEQIQKLNKSRLDAVDAAIASVKKQVASYLDAERRKAQEAQQRAYQQAQEAAAEERRKQTEALRLQVASEQAEAGDHVAAEASLFDETIQAPPTPVYVPQVTMPTSTLAGRKNWKANLVNLEDLILDVAAGIESWRKTGKTNGHASVNVLEANMTALNQLAKAQEDMLSIPGVVAYNDPVVSSRQKGK